jgi:glucosamine--fructose-6-phosphate aminotransferase (isomerizing)
MIALRLAKAKGTMSNSDFHRYLQELEVIPEKVAEALKTNDVAKAIAAEFKDAPNCLYLGRGYNFPVALEGALKLKEISYIHAEGYPAAEMKHGPIALIDEHMPVIVIAPISRKSNQGAEESSQLSPKAMFRFATWLSMSLKFPIPQMRFLRC